MPSQIGSPKLKTTIGQVSRLRALQCSSLREWLPVRDLFCRRGCKCRLHRAHPRAVAGQARRELSNRACRTLVVNGATRIRALMSSSSSQLITCVGRSREPRRRHTWRVYERRPRLGLRDMRAICATKCFSPRRRSARLLCHLLAPLSRSSRILWSPWSDQTRALSERPIKVAPFKGRLRNKAHKKAHQIGSSLADSDPAGHRRYCGSNGANQLETWQLSNPHLIEGSRLNTIRDPPAAGGANWRQRSWQKSWQVVVVAQRAGRLSDKLTATRRLHLPVWCWFAGTAVRQTE